MMAEIHREEAGRGAETGIEADEGKARGQPNRCAVKGGEAERGHRRVREGEKEGGRADEGGVEGETWRGGGGERELRREAGGNGTAEGRRYRHRGGREGEGRGIRRGGGKVGNHAESEETAQGGARYWGGGKGILRNKNQQNQDGEVSRGMLPDQSNQERTGRPLKKVSLEELRKEEPGSKGNLPAPPPLPAGKEKEKANGPPAKIEMADGRPGGRSFGAVGGIGRGGPGRGGGGMEGGYGEGVLGERGGFMRTPGGGSRGLSMGAQTQSGREAFGRGAGRGGGPRGAGSLQRGGRTMWNPMRVAASLAGKYLTAVSPEAIQVAEGAGGDSTSKAEALLQRMTQVAAEEQQALEGEERTLTKALKKGENKEEWTPKEGRQWPTTEATKVDNRLKEQEGMSPMVSVTLRNLGVGQGGVNGVFPQHTPEQARKIIEAWFHKSIEGAVSVAMLYGPSMSGWTRDS